MKTIYPKKLQPGDEIRVIAPANSLSIVPKTSQRIAQERLERMGFVVTFGKNVRKKDLFGSSSIEQRLEDLNEAFRDRNVRMILAATGGYNSNQLLPYLDEDLIRQNPKILCGYSDITALANAIYARTGLVTYSGPCFSTFGMKKGFTYTQDFFEKCVTQEEPIVVESSAQWSDDSWDTNQNKRVFLKNTGTYVVQNGKAEGKMIGGNLCTFNLLQGTLYMPSLKNTVLCIEDDDLVKEYFAEEFERNLQSLIQQSGFSGVRGIVFGRFQKRCKITRKKLIEIVRTKKELLGIPIIANADFGHTTPQFTFPIGGEVKLRATSNSVRLVIQKH